MHSSWVVKVSEYLFVTFSLFYRNVYYYKYNKHYERPKRFYFFQHTKKYDYGFTNFSSFNGSAYCGSFCHWFRSTTLCLSLVRLIFKREYYLRTCPYFPNSSKKGR